jgi:hypothetical protein
VIGKLPRNLSDLDREEVVAARRDRDDRMSVLFRGWPSLSEMEMNELRKLNDERQRLASHLGALRSLRTLRMTPKGSS